MSKPMRFCDALEIWTVYDHPSDYPHDFIARKWLVTPQGELRTEHVVTAPTLAAVRALLPPGLGCIARAPADDPVIVESWL